MCVCVSLRSNTVVIQLSLASTSLAIGRHRNFGAHGGGDGDDKRGKLHQKHEVQGVFHTDVSIEGTQIFFASRRHRGALRPRTRNGARSARVKIRPQLLQPLSSSVFLERGRTRWPRTPAAGVCAAAMLGTLLELVQPHCITPLVARWQRASFGIDCKQLGRVFVRSRS